MSKSGRSSLCDAFQLVADAKPARRAVVPAFAQIGLILDAVAGVAPGQIADINEGALHRHNVALGLLRMTAAWRAAQARDRTSAPRKRWPEKRRPRPTARRDQQLVAEHRAVGALLLLGVVLRLALGLLDHLDRQRLVDHPHRKRPGRQLQAARAAAAARCGGAGCDGGTIGDGSGGVCANETPAANSARAIPRHAQETRNMLQQPRNAPQRGVLCEPRRHLMSSTVAETRVPIRPIPASGST